MEQGTFVNYPALAGLPVLVRRQRRLEALIAPHVAALNKAEKPGELPLTEREKAVRGDIDLLLVRAGLKNCEGVTCIGYDVTHYHRPGLSTLNVDKLTEALVANGVDKEWLAGQIKLATDTADDVKFALVKPSKGAKVRTPAA